MNEVLRFLFNLGILSTNGFCHPQVDELVARSHKFRVATGDRPATHGARLVAEDLPRSVSVPPLPALSHASFVATPAPGCARETQVPSTKTHHAVTSSDAISGETGAVE